MADWSRRLAAGASGAVDLESEEGRAFLQERLAFLPADLEDRVLAEAPR